MKTIWKFIIAIWFLAWTTLGIFMYLDTPKQIDKDSKFKTQHIDPLVDSVRHFVTINKRIPTDNEFNKLKSSNDGELITKYTDLPDEFKDEVKIVDWDNDSYAIAIWRGEWNEGYISKNEKYILNNYSSTDGLTGLLIMISIGLLPTLLTLLNLKTNR